MTDQPPYSAAEHSHRFACWAASRGASVIGKRFSVEEGKSILERSGFTPDFKLPNGKPTPKKVDRQHMIWRDAVKRIGKKHHFTDGVAAKLINIYLKVRFVVGAHQHSWVDHLHPPIDSILLERLYKDDLGGIRKEWRRLKNVRWSNFGSEDYQDVINHIRAERKLLPLWSIEEYWKGHQ